MADWVPERDDDLSRWALWSKGRGVISHDSALAAHMIGEFESPQVHLTVPRGFSSRDPAVRLHVAELADEDVVQHSGYRVTTVLRSLVDVAAARAEEDQLARAIAEAIEGGHTTLLQLRTRSEEVDIRGALAIERAIGWLNLA